MGFRYPSTLSRTRGSFERSTSIHPLQFLIFFGSSLSYREWLCYHAYYVACSFVISSRTFVCHRLRFKYSQSCWWASSFGEIFVSLFSLGSAILEFEWRSLWLEQAWLLLRAHGSVWNPLSCCSRELTWSTDTGAESLFFFSWCFYSWGYARILPVWWQRPPSDFYICVAAATFWPALRFWLLLWLGHLRQAPTHRHRAPLELVSTFSIA